jgi:hypothetical protein
MEEIYVNEKGGMAINLPPFCLMFAQVFHHPCIYKYKQITELTQGIE